MESGLLECRSVGGRGLRGLSVVGQVAGARRRPSRGPPAHQILPSTRGDCAYGSPARVRAVQTMTLSRAGKGECRKEVVIGKGDSAPRSAFHHHVESGGRVEVSQVGKRAAQGMGGSTHGLVFLTDAFEVFPGMPLTRLGGGATAGGGAARTFLRGRPSPALTGPTPGGRVGAAAGMRAVRAGGLEDREAWLIASWLMQRSMWSLTRARSEAGKEVCEGVNRGV